MVARIECVTIKANTRGVAIFLGAGRDQPEDLIAIILDLIVTAVDVHVHVEEKLRHAQSEAVRHLRPAADAIHQDILLREIVFSAKPPKARAPLPCPVLEILVVLFVAVFIHFVAADVRAIALEVRPDNQGQIMLVGKLDKPLEATVVGDVDFDILRLGAVGAEREHATHGLALSAYRACVLICLRGMLRQAKEEGDVAVVLKLGRLDEFVEVCRLRERQLAGSQKP